MQDSSYQDTIYLEVDGYTSPDFKYQFEVFASFNRPIGMAGSWLKSSELSFPPNRYVVRVLPRDALSGELLIRVDALWRSALSELTILEHDFEQAVGARSRHRATYYQSHVLDIVFFSALGICLLLAGNQYVLFRERAYASYLLYLIFILIYYFRGVEGPYGILLTIHGQFGQQLQAIFTTLQYSTFTAYIAFIYFFLNIRQTTSPFLILSSGLICSTGYVRSYSL